jgi:hypothetical protein
VSASESRRRRQVEELARLCRAGAAARAIDLAFEHLATFGRDDAVIALLAAAIERSDAPADVRRRFTELTSER